MGLFGVLGGSQEVIVSGVTTLDSGSILRGKNSVIANGGLKVSGDIVLEGRTLVNNAAAIWNSPVPAAFTFDNGATLVNSSAATFDLAFDGILGGGPSTNAFIN